MVKITRHKTGTIRDLGFLTVSVFLYSRHGKILGQDLKNRFS